MSMLDDDLMEQYNFALAKLKMRDDSIAKELFGKGLVSAVIAEEKEDTFAKKLAGMWSSHINYKTSFAQRIDEVLKNAISPELQEHQSREIFSIDCRTLRKGDTHGWLSAIAQTGVNDPIFIIEYVTQIPDGDRTIYDDPIYVTNLLLRTWKNEDIFAGDLHIDRRQFTVILTCSPQDADILQRECGLCSYAWLGDFEEYLRGC